MRKLMIGLALAGASIAALPAAAQDYDRDYRDGYGYRDRGYGSDSLRRASWMLERAIQRGSLSRREIYYYRNELRQLHRLEARFRYDGHYSRWEREQIDHRANRLIYRLRAERRDDRYRDRWEDDRRDDDRWDD